MSKLHLKKYLQGESAVTMNHVAEEHGTGHEPDDERRLQETQVDVGLVSVDILLDKIIYFNGCAGNNTTIYVVE